MKLSRKRILSFTAIFLFLIVLIFTAVYLKSVADYKRSVKETTFSNLDISNVPDGVYVGEPEAVDAVLRHYTAYIKSLSMYKEHINDDTQDRLKTKLVEAILKFRFDR